MNHAVMFNSHRESALLQGSGEEFCADNRPWDGATIADPLKRLTAILNKNNAGAIITKYEYTYNTLDLKDTETITGASPLDNLTDGTTTYTPNDVNQIVSSTNPNRTYTYDNDGNMTTGFTPEGYTLALSYDAASRLIKAEYTDSGNTVHKTEYTYDGDDLLAIMKKTIGTSITETRYIRAGFLPIQERDGANAITREYLWGQDMGGGIGGLLNLRQSGADYNYLYDGKGNVTSLIDAAQATVAQYVYDPFGRVMKKTGTLDQPFQFSTKQYDAETGHNYYGYRFYSPQLGRWINRDPIEEAGGVNLYQMVGNDPVNWGDPEGLEPLLHLPPSRSWKPPIKRPEVYPKEHSYEANCINCNWEKLAQCAAQAYDSEQIKQCKDVCRAAKNTGPHLKLELQAACAACVAGKTGEAVDCIKEFCKVETCCRRSKAWEGD